MAKLLEDGPAPDALKRFVEDSGLSYSQNFQSFIFNCSRCGGRKKIYVRKADGKFTCWKCPESDRFGGYPEYAFAELLGQSVEQIQQQLYGTARTPAAAHIDLELFDFFDDDRPEDVDPEPPLVVKSRPYNHLELTHQHSARGVAYLEGRGVSLEVALRYGIRYCPEDRAVVFPVEADGKLYGWQTRSVANSDKLTSWGLPRERLLLFADRLKGQDHVIFTEGPMDALKADLCGGNVATMGKKITRRQLLMGTAGKKKCYLGLDPDAYEEANRLLREVDSELEVYDMIPATWGKDLGQMSFAEVLDLFRGARRVEQTHLFVFLKPPGTL